MGRTLQFKVKGRNVWPGGIPTSKLGKKVLTLDNDKEGK